LKRFLHNGDQAEALQIGEGLSNPLGDKPSEVLIPPDPSNEIERSDPSILLLSQQPNPGEDERVIEPRNLQGAMLTGFKGIKNLRHHSPQKKAESMEQRA
jgi:hypothetical protein